MAVKRRGSKYAASKYTAWKAHLGGGGGSRHSACWPIGGTPSRLVRQLVQSTGASGCMQSRGAALEAGQTDSERLSQVEAGVKGNVKSLRRG